MASNPLIDALRAATTPLLVRQLRAMFEGADDALFSMSQRAAASENHQATFDAMRLLRLERRKVEAEFERMIVSSFQVTADSLIEEFDLDRLAVMPTEELEEKIAIGNLVTKAESLHPAQLKDLRLRITHMIRDLGVPISRHALLPAVICNAFKASFTALDLPLPLRLLLYKLFDAACISRLHEPFDAGLKALDALNVRAPEQQAAAGPAWSPFGTPQAPVEAEETLTPPTLDSSTRGALEEIGSEFGGYRPPDAAFAQELLGFASVEAHARPTVGRVAPAQRMSLVGQMCNEILSDPHLPPTMRPLFERLRFPLIKIALADGTFFSNRVHPVRRLVAEAAETAASSRVASQAVVRRLEERLRHIAEQIDLSATFVRPQISQLLPLTMLEIASFLDQQREESETRRENVLNKVRRTVAQELEVHTLGRKPSTPLVNFLRMGWGPLMAARLLRHGMNSRMWIDAINRLVQVLASMDAMVVTQEHLAVREEILAAIGTDLRDIGMREDKVSTARSFLQRAYVELDERLAQMSPEELELSSLDLELLSPMETAAVLAEFPAPGSAQNRAPAPDVVREPLRTDALALKPPPVVAPAPPSKPSAPPVVLEAPEPPAARALIVEPAAPEPAPEAAPAAPTSEQAEIESAPAPLAQMIAPAADEPDIAADATDTELLTLCLTAESWFRVFDASNGQTLWLKVSRYYPEHGSVGFNGFDAKKTLSIRAARFIDDLVSGRSEPVNASPVQARAMAELRTRHKKH